MTTLSGVPENPTQTGDDTPRNRAAAALEFVGPATSPPADLTDQDREIAAWDVAAAIRRCVACLTVNERIVLAAALLPEFQVAP